MEPPRAGAARCGRGAAVSEHGVRARCVQFRVVGDGPERHYVGEASELRRRFQQYRTPGSSQRTNLRLNQLFRDHLEGGGHIEVDVAEGVQLGSDGGPTADLNDASLRKLVESTGIVAGKAEGLGILNR